MAQPRSAGLGTPSSSRRPAPRLAPWWKRPWPWIALGLAVVFLGNSGFRRLVSRWWELRKLRAELASLKAEEKRLEGRIEAAKRGGPALERAARQELGYLKPGEVEYRFPPPAKPRP